MKVLKTALIIIMAQILIVVVGVYALLAVMNRRNTNYWKYTEDILVLRYWQWLSCPSLLGYIPLGLSLSGICSMFL